MKHLKQCKIAGRRLVIRWIVVTGLLLSLCCTKQCFLQPTQVWADASLEKQELPLQQTDRETSSDAQVVTLAPTELYAKAAVLMDAGTGRVLYEKDGTEKLSNASTTKIMTCILVLEQECEEQIAEVSAYASAQPKVHLGVRNGQQFLVQDLLYSLMLESHNDSAVILAEHIGSKLLGLSTSAGERDVEESKQAVAAFSRLMNEKALEIGCTDTTFVTPNGLDAVQVTENADGEEIILTHGTTATDLARIMAYCVVDSPEREDFLNITRAVNYSFSDVSGSRTYSCRNHNAFLGMMEGALSGKTGFTNSAGYCYVGALQRDERVYTISLLACGWPNHKSWKWEDSRKLYSYGLENYQYRDFLPSVQIPSLPVLDGQSEDGNPYHGIAVKPVLEKVEPMRILCCRGENMVAELESVDQLEAPVKAGTQAGIVTYYFVTAQGERIPWRSAALCVTENIPCKDEGFVLKYIMKQFFLGIY